VGWGRGVGGEELVGVLLVGTDWLGLRCWLRQKKKDFIFFFFFFF
jgi:hypothetical protein